jgi:hypothetical protein
MNNPPGPAHRRIDDVVRIRLHAIFLVLRTDERGHMRNLCTLASASTSLRRVEAFRDGHRFAASAE